MDEGDNLPRKVRIELGNYLIDNDIIDVDKVSKLFNVSKVYVREVAKSKGYTSDKSCLGFWGYEY